MPFYLAPLSLLKLPFPFWLQSCDLHIISECLKPRRHAFMFYKKLLFWRLPSTPAEELKLQCTNSTLGFLISELGSILDSAGLYFSKYLPGIKGGSWKHFHHRGQCEKCSSWSQEKELIVKPDIMCHPELKWQLPKHDFISPCLIQTFAVSCCGRSHQIQFQVIACWPAGDSNFLSVWAMEPKLHLTSVWGYDS